MTPTDPRHGTYAGYVAGCRDDCCRRASRTYHAIRTHERENLGRPRTIPAIGTHRRIQALLAIGWTYRDMANRLGYSREAVRQVLLHQRVHRSTAEQIERVYRELSMTLPPTDTHAQRVTVARARNKAARNGWPVPLAWDDEAIDDPKATPAVVESWHQGADIDEWLHLVRCGEDPERAARRCGVGLNAIETAARRNDRRDVLAWISRRAA